MFKKTCLLLVTVTLLASASLGVLAVLHPTKTFAVTGSDWKPGRIIDDQIFVDKNSMSVSDVQNFLNQKVGTGGYDSIPGQCDTNGTRSAQPFGSGTRAQYAASTGRSTKFTCLSNYYEVPKTSPGPGIPANNYGGAAIPAGAKSAAQLIWDAAQAYNISPKVLLVTIQKESAGPLTTDDWPFLSQFTYAMGAHCPDSGPGGSANCDANYAGFSIQIAESARLFRSYLDGMDQPWWGCTEGGKKVQCPANRSGGSSPGASYKVPYTTNYILWNVSQTGCGGGNIYIENKATAALYYYTPYQPNQAALNNLYGTGNNCSAYGNRNFWRIFSDWFGSTLSTSGHILNKSLETNELSTGTVMRAGDYIVSTNGKFVTTMQYDGNLVTYAGHKAVWNSGTSGYGNYASFQSDGNFVVYNAGNGPLWWSTTWGVGANRLALHDDGNLHIYADTTEKFSTDNRVNSYARNNVGTQIASETRFNAGDYIKSPDSRYTLVMQDDGNLVMYSADGAPIWNSGTAGRPGSYTMVQNDGNLVVYSSGNSALWWTGTWSKGASTLKMQNDGNLVLYRNSDNAFTWATWSQFNNYQVNDYIGSQISSGTTLHAGDYLRSPDWRFTLVMQNDGNLVVYSVDRYTPIWNSRTWNNAGAYATLQNDGNFVVYDKNGSALWNTFTYTQGSSVLKMQSDGNLVSYRDSGGWATWNSFGY